MKNLKRIQNGRGGSRVGSVKASIAELVELFGPFEDVAKKKLDGKVTTQWSFQNGNNTFSIYDYKETSLDSETLPSLEKFRANNSRQITWSVGGNTNGDDFIEHIENKLAELRKKHQDKPKRELKFIHTEDELTIRVMEGYCCAFEARLAMHAADPAEFKRLAVAVEEQAREILK
ncbi:MAG: hypothetical protein R2827_14720 [Bdellovibrionales bacterium]